MTGPRLLRNLKVETRANYTVSLIRMFIAFSGHHHSTVESEQRTLHLTVNSLTRECVNNGTSKVHRNFLRNNGERNKEKKQYDFYSFHTKIICAVFISVYCGLSTCPVRKNFRSSTAHFCSIPAL